MAQNMTSPFPNQETPFHILLTPWQAVAPIVSTYMAACQLVSSLQVTTLCFGRKETPMVARRFDAT